MTHKRAIFVHVFFRNHVSLWETEIGLLVVFPLGSLRSGPAVACCESCTAEIRFHIFPRKLFGNFCKKTTGNCELNKTPQ